MRPRGYLLLEASVGGAMAAVVLFGMMSFIVSGRVQNTAASRMITANHLVNEALEQTRAGATPATANLVAAGGRYRRTVSTTACTETRGAFSLACSDVEVTVAFDVVDEGVTRTRSTTGTLRMYP